MSFVRIRLPAAGWKRWLALIGLTVAGLFLSLVVLGLSVWLAFQSPAFQGWFMRQMITLSSPVDPEETPGHPGCPPTYTGPVGDGRRVTAAADIFNPTNIWNIHLQFTEPQWAAIQHRRVTPVPNWMQPDGSVVLRNTNASRNGLAGAIGFDFPWSAGDVEFGGVTFTNAGIRFKGNGTYLGGLRGYRKPFKLDLRKHAKSQTLGGRSVFNLGNLSADFTCLSDTLAYEFFRQAGVPAPRTAFARVFLSLAGTETNRLLGLYLIVENPDADWAREQFGEPDVALFKPVTYELFSDLGTNWTAYAGIYDPKTKLLPAQPRRLMELARFVTHSSDEEFAARVGEFVDLAEFSRFLAAEVLLANYDGILANGQNLLLFLDPRTERFGFIPWDLDHSWGEFPFIATAEERERASIWHPWIGSNRFLERMLAVAAVKQQYRAELERLLGTLFVPARLNHRVDEVAAAVRPLVAEWSTNRLAKFETAVAGQPYRGLRDTGNPMDPNRPAWQLKRFIAARAANVREQLDGKVEGIVLKRQAKNN